MKILSIGELLMRLTVPDNLRFAQAEQFRLDVGGSEANVAMTLSQLGWGARMLSALPDNDLGDRICRELSRCQVDISHIGRMGKRVGIYFLEEGNSLRSSRIIYDRADSAVNELSPEDVNWESVFQGVTHLHWSAITPALSQNAADICQEAVDRASELGVTVSCDLHFRKNLWAYGKEPGQIIPALLEKSSIVLGDPSTIQALTGIEMESRKLGSIERVSQLTPDYRKLMDRFTGVKCVSMLLRTVHSANHHELKSVMVTNDHEYESSSIDVDNMKERIGGGDAYMAGLLFGLEHHEDRQKSIEFALTLSALKHTILGDYFRGNLQDVERVMNSNQQGKIIR
ncbi:MAG: sugar kinase [Roseivirga sp.]|nr:sugar kinase [Roseivirga sp.]